MTVGLDELQGGWRRPLSGRRIAGVAALLASKWGLSARLLRTLFVLAALGGMALAVLFAVFDQALFGAPASALTRSVGVFVGALLVMAYPLCALFLPDEASPRRWDFAGAVALIVLLMFVGQAVGFLVAPYWGSAKEAVLARGAVGWITWPADHFRGGGVGAKDVVLALFFVSTLGFLILQRRAVLRFSRAMPTGVALVTLSTLAIAVGVMVPQIDGFEDPDQRVDLVKEQADYQLFREFGYQKLPASLQDGHEQYEAFRWAEGYFLYHLLHMYGIGMPEGAIPPRVEESLASWGEKYGEEEAKNRFKQMRAAFSGREKINEIGAFINRNEASLWRFFEVATLLHLNRTYKSHWFATLLALVGFSVFVSGYRNWRFRAARLPRGFLGALAATGFVFFLKLTTALSIPWGDTLVLGGAVLAVGTLLGAGVPGNVVSLQKLGFFIVHNGMLLLLVGGLTSKLFTDRGILHLLLGDPPKDTYLRHFDPGKPARMPFSVQLDHFGRRDWSAIEVHFLQEDFTSRPPRYTLWKGREVELDHVEDEYGSRNRLELEVLGLHDSAQIGLPHASEAPPGEEGRPLAELSIENDGHGHAPGEGHRRYLPPLVQPVQTYRDEVVRDPRGAFRLAASYGDDPGEHFPVEAGQLGFLEVTVVGAEDGAPRSYPIRLDQTLTVPGGYTVRVVDASADFGPERGDQNGSTHSLPLEAQPYGFAAVWVDITGPDDAAPERRLVLEAIDAVEQGHQDDYFHSDVRLQFTWDDWTAPGPPRYLLCWGEEDGASLLAEDGVRAPVVLGERLDLPGETQVFVSQVLRRAKLEENIRFGDRGAVGAAWDAGFYSRDPHGLELRITEEPGTPLERTHIAKMATTEYGQSNLWFAEDGRVAIRFVENSEMLPFEWRSVLSIFEPGPDGRLREVDLGPEQDREIRVNDYFYYRGYRFFQTNALAEEPRYSGIGVVYDPGIPVVLLGMYTIILGSCVAFLVRPIVLGRKTATPELAS